MKLINKSELKNEDLTLYAQVDIEGDTVKLYLAEDDVVTDRWLIEARNVQKEAIQQAFNKEIDKPVTVQAGGIDGVYGANKRDINEIKDISTTGLSARIPVSRDLKHTKRVGHTVADIRKISNALIEHRSGLHDKFDDLFDEIDNASTIDDIKFIQW